MKVSIVFCGGCNPQIDRSMLAVQLAKQLQAKGHTVLYNTLQADYIIYLSGCQADCATKYHPCSLPSVAVTGKQIDYHEVAEQEQDKAVMEILDGYCNSLLENTIKKQVNNSRCKGGNDCDDR